MGRRDARARRRRGRPGGEGLTPEQAHALLAGSHVARLATAGADGRPHVVPVVFALLGDHREEGPGSAAHVSRSAIRLVSAVDHKPKRTRALRRLANVAENPRVSVLADHYDEDWARLWWVRADGAAHVLEAGSEDERRAIDALVLKYRQYDDHRPAGPVLAIAIERLTGWAAGEAP